MSRLTEGRWRPGKRLKLPRLVYSLRFSFLLYRARFFAKSDRAAIICDLTATAMPVNLSAETINRNFLESGMEV